MEELVELNHLSKTSKMSGVLSWSLMALETCPGAYDQGQLVLSCQCCYATTGRYIMPNVIKVRKENKLAWQHDNWASLMINEIKYKSYFRWFDSGDMYSLKLAEKIYEIMVNTPDTKHWLPTKMYKFDKFKPIIDKMQSLPNVCVRFSSDSITGSYAPGLHRSVILSSVNNVNPNIFVCPAYKNGGKCGDCRACYNKDVDVVGYKAHGYKANRLLKNRCDSNGY